MKVAIAKLRAMREAKGVTLAELAVPHRHDPRQHRATRIAEKRHAANLERYAAGLGCVLEIGFPSADVKSRKRAPTLQSASQATS